MNWNKQTKEIFNYSLAIFMILFGCGLTIAGFIVPPLGEISASVLTMLGESLTFAGALLGISLHYSNELTQFKTKVNEKLREENLEEVE